MTDDLIRYDTGGLTLLYKDMECLENCRICDIKFLFIWHYSYCKCLNLPLRSKLLLVKEELDKFQTKYRYAFENKQTNRKVK